MSLVLVIAKIILILLTHNSFSFLLLSAKNILGIINQGWIPRLEFSPSCFLCFENIALIPHDIVPLPNI